MTLLLKVGTGNILIRISLLVKGVQLVLKVKEKVTRISVLADVSHIRICMYNSVCTLLYVCFCIWDTSARTDILVTFSSTLSTNCTPFTKILIPIKMFPVPSLKSRVIICI